MNAISRSKRVLALVVIATTLALVLVPVYHVDDRWISALSAIGTIWAAVAAAWAVIELRAERIERDQPRVVAQIQVSFKQTLRLEVMNVGSGTAYDIQFHFDPVPRAPGHKAVDEVSAYRDGFPSLVPGEKLLPFILWFGARLDELSEKKFDLTISYKDISGNVGTFKRHFDLERIRDLHLGIRTIEESLADRQDGLIFCAREIVKELQKINDGLRSIGAEPTTEEEDGEATGVDEKELAP